MVGRGSGLFGTLLFGRATGFGWLRVVKVLIAVLVIHFGLGRIAREVRLGPFVGADAEWRLVGVRPGLRPRAVFRLNLPKRGTVTRRTEG